VTQPTSGRESRPPVAASRRHGGRFALLALAALFTVRLPLPWMGLTLLLVVAADFEGVRTARALLRERTRRTMVTWCVCGIALVTLVGLGVVGTFAIYPITYQRQECLQGANTQVAQAQCQSTFDRRIANLQSTFLR
jgi:hypothetical protein